MVPTSNGCYQLHSVSEKNIKKRTGWKSWVIGFTKKCLKGQPTFGAIARHILGKGVEGTDFLGIQKLPSSKT